MKKFTAYIDVIDNDYRAWVGTEQVEVDSWDEAEEYCRKEDWSGYSHMVDSLRDNKTGKGFGSRKEFNDGN